MSVELTSAKKYSDPLLKKKRESMTDYYADLESPLSVASKAPPSPYSIVGLDGEKVIRDGFRTQTQEIISKPPTRKDIIFDICSGLVPGFSFTLGIIIYYVMSKLTKKCINDCVVKNQSCTEECYRDTFWTKFFRIGAASVPVIIMLIWYIIKTKIKKREHKVGVIKFVIYGYLGSLMLIIMSGGAFFMMKN